MRSAINILALFLLSSLGLAGDLAKGERPDVCESMERPYSYSFKDDSEVAKILTGKWVLCNTYNKGPTFGKESDFGLEISSDLSWIVLETKASYSYNPRDSGTFKIVNDYLMKYDTLDAFINLNVSLSKSFNTMTISNGLANFSSLYVRAH